MENNNVVLLSPTLKLEMHLFLKQYEITSLIQIDSNLYAKENTYPFIIFPYQIYVSRFY